MDNNTEHKQQDTLGVFGRTERGFAKVTFEDEYQTSCSLQESSRAVCEKEDGTVDDPLGWLWLGVDDAEPRIMKVEAFRLGLPVAGPLEGWMPYRGIPDQVLLTTRMHLNEMQVRGLVARMNLWLATGQICSEEEALAESSNRDK